MKYSRIFGLFLAIFFLVSGVNRAVGFSINSSTWTRGSTVTIELELGATNVALLDGLGTWNNSAADALTIWNGQLDFVKFDWILESNAPKGSPDGFNSIFYASTIFGEGFGKDTLAVTVWWSSPENPALRAEADVVVNSAQTFNSYRGPLKSAFDFHRVALHEFGHVLGLEHVTNYPPGQAMMEPVISNLDHLAADDIAGAAFLYGYRITSNPTVVGPVVGEYFEYYVVANNEPVSFAATGLPPGLLIDSASGKISGVCTEAGEYSVVVTAHSLLKDVSATITMIFAPAAITSLDCEANIGSPITYTITAENNPTSFSASDLPPGLVLDRKTGVISGIPTLTGSYDTAVAAYGPAYDASGIVNFRILPIYTAPFGYLNLAAPVIRMIPDPTRARLYVLSYDDITIIDAAAFSIVRTIDLPDARDMAMSPDHSTLWVTSGRYGAFVSGFDLNNFSAVPPIPNGPYGADSIGAGLNHRLYLVNSDGLFQVDVTFGTVKLVLPRSNSGLQWLIEMSPDGRDLYLAYQERLPGMIAHYDVAGPDARLVDQRQALGYVGQIKLSADEKTLVYLDYTSIPVPRSDVFSLSVADLQASPYALADTSVIRAWSLSSDSPVTYVFPQSYSSFIPVQYLDFINTTTGFLTDRWVLNSSPLQIVDGTGPYLFGSTSSAVVAYSRPTSIPPEPSSAPKRLLNVSTRAVVGTDDEQLIAGFIITGSGDKQIALRSIGPTLAVLNPISDPVLEVYDSKGALVANNDNWNSNRDAVVAAALGPLDEHEAAIIASLEPGSYTAVVKNAVGGRGVGLVEVYDLSPESDARLANLSTRGRIGTGDDVVIGGFIVGGTEATKLILRATGPTLFDAGVSGFLQDPLLELRGQNGDLFSQNDNWRSDQEAEIVATSLAPSDDLESAIVATLQPGPYTAIMRGVNDTTGVGLIEIYNLDAVASGEN